MVVLATNDCTLCAYQCYAPSPPLVGATWGIWTSKISVALGQPLKTIMKQTHSVAEVAETNWKRKVGAKINCYYGICHLVMNSASYILSVLVTLLSQICLLWRLACNIFNKRSWWRCVLQFLQIQAIRRHKHHILCFWNLHVCWFCHCCRLQTATHGTREHAQANNLNWVMI